MPSLSVALTAERVVRTDQDAVGVRYHGLILARLRKQPGSPVFTPLKNGFGGISLTVNGHSIEIRASGPGGKLARLLGVDYTFAAPDVSMSTTRLGWLGTLVFARDWVVLTSLWTKPVVQIAISPCDGDLNALKQALIDAGVPITASG